MSETQSQYTLDDLLYLMSRLRDPKDGCPWDQQQNFATIIPHSIEEVYELADAIAAEDSEHIHEELGDLLFQVIFFCQLGSEQGQFNFNKVVSTLVAKLLRRHPHVFPDGTLGSRAGEQVTPTAEVKKNWEAIKAAERQRKQQGGVLDDVPLALPGLTRATKLQKRAATVGFDWPDYRGVFDKVREEIDELQEAVEVLTPAEVEEELGDLYFVIANLARHLKVDSEAALRAANRKFERRFGYIEGRLKESDQSFGESSLDELESLWQQAKQNGL